NGSLCTTRHSVHPSNRQLFHHHKCLVFHRGNQRCSVPGHPVRRRHYHPLYSTQADKSDVVRPDVPEVDCAMVTNRLAVHHSCSIRFSRSSSCASDRLGSQGCCTPDCILRHNLLLYAHHMPSTRLWIPT